ncbi:hypothetical protein E4P30_26515, partial [Herbaspirillum sp. 3C11]
RIAITPHISALTVRSEAARQIAEKIVALQRGEPVVGLVDRSNDGLSVAPATPGASPQWRCRRG